MRYRPLPSVEADRTKPSGLIPHRDRCASNDRARGIEHATLQDRRGLREGRRGAAEQGRQHERQPATRNLRETGTRTARRSQLAVDHFRRTNRFRRTPSEPRLSRRLAWSNMPGLREHIEVRVSLSYGCAQINWPMGLHRRALRGPSTSDAVKESDGRCRFCIV